jgi:DNA-binding transcriptional LysR family regulator
MGPGNRPLDLDWLEDFIHLAEIGNFSRAAESRAIAQPAFSRHIRSLEEWVGVELVDRSAHPTVLTAAGRRFLPLVQEATASLQAARIKARQAHDQAAASLRFACTHVLAITFFPRWLASLESQLRPGPIQTMADHYQACEDLMLQRRTQFMLCYGHPMVRGRLDEGAHPVHRLGEDVLVPMSAPISNQQEGPLHSLSRGGPLPLLDYSEDSGLGRITRTVFKGRLSPDPAPSPVVFGQSHPARLTVSAVFTAHDALLLKRMALDGRGLAWLPRTLAAEELLRGDLVMAGDETWCVPLEIRLYRQPAELAPVAERLWAVATQPLQEGEAAKLPPARNRLDGTRPVL